MSNSKHTPGPWTIGGTIARRHCIRSAEQLVAKSHGATELETEANASLISAAPELLEAVATIYSLANLQPLLETKYSKALVHDIMKQMQGAIAKARGES